METTKYSREKFDGYTHRFIVKFKVSDDWREDESVHIYSDSGSKDELNKFIREKKKPRVISFDIVHVATKEQDEATSEFLEEFLKDI